MRLIVVTILAYIFYRVLKNIFYSDKDVETDINGRVIDDMVQDPVCKTYIPRRDAIKKSIKGRQYFFCSEECASKFSLND